MKAFLVLQASKSRPTPPPRCSWSDTARSAGTQSLFLPFPLAVHTSVLRTYILLVTHVCRYPSVLLRTLLCVAKRESQIPSPNFLACR